MVTYEYIAESLLLAQRYKSNTFFFLKKTSSIPVNIIPYKMSSILLDICYSGYWPQSISSYEGIVHITPLSEL